MINSDRLTAGTLGTLMPPAANITRNAQRNESQGYAALWWPDHYMGWFPQSVWTPDITPLAAFQSNPDIFFDPLVAMAAAAGATSKVTLGTAVTEALRRHPVELAQAFLTLDHLAPGRVICGLGSGEALNLLPYGIPFERPVGRLQEAVRIIRLLWSSDGPVDFEGEHFHLRQAVLGLEPTTQGPPEIWLAAHGPRMLDITGRYADGWLPEFLPLDDYRSRLKRIHQARQDAGRSADPFTPAMYVVEGVPPAVVEAGVLHGTPEEVAQELATYARVGLRHVVLWNVTFFSDANLIRRSYQLMSTLLDLLRDIRIGEWAASSTR
ncbi:MAG: LLM class flavin-dependent oxidoreductase [Chloroflexi bacterium]|nr:MAG: LLM class flavin-dependent oxidoreductase [Chloroflexota bacterium]